MQVDIEKLTIDQMRSYRDYLSYRHMLKEANEAKPTSLERAKMGFYLDEICKHAVNLASSFAFEDIELYKHFMDKAAFFDRARRLHRAI